MTGAPASAVAETIERFCPQSLSPAVARFAKEMVAGAAAQSPARAKAFLFAASKLGTFAEAVGLELSADVLLHPSVIERCCGPEASAMSAPTRRTVRSNLRSLARILGPAGPAAAALPRERAKVPYSAGEVAAFLALADAQPTALRRARANALVCLGAGAGLVGGELRRVRGHDVVCRSGGVLVRVGGRRPRAVPVLGPYHDRLLGAARFFGEATLVSGRNPDTHNVTNPIIRSLSGGAELVRLEPGRLRSTWLVAVAEAIGLRAFMDAAGIRCSQRLGDLVVQLDVPAEADAVARLGGRR